MMLLLWGIAFTAVLRRLRLQAQIQMYPQALQNS